MSFGKSFGNELGRDTATTLLNFLGIDYGRKHTVRIDRSSDRDSARARLADERREIEHKNFMNELDEAVLNNVDLVVDTEFPSNPEALCSTLMNLMVQLDANSWGNIFSEESRIRNKYTSAVLTKLKVGARKLEIIDHNNLQIDDFKDCIRKGRWRKFWGIYWPIFSIFAFIMLIVYAIISSDYPDAKGRFWIVVGTIILVFLAIIIIPIVKAKKERNARVQANIAIKQENEPSTHKKNKEVLTEKAPMTAENKSEQIVRPNKPTPNVGTIVNTLLDIRLKKEPVTVAEKLQRQYDELWLKYQDKHDILKRGYAASNTDSHKSILIVGINPSYQSKEKGYRMYNLPPFRTGYWGNVNRMLDSMNTHLQNDAAYIDIFAFRETDQEEGMKQIIQNPSMFDYVVEQVSMVQIIIEEIIRPKVIVVKNKAVWAFWGKLPEYTWMGYTFKHINNLDCGELCQITGFIDKNDRINSNITQTNLKGSYIIFTTHTAVESYPSPEYLQTLLPQADF